MKVLLIAWISIFAHCSKGGGGTTPQPPPPPDPPPVINSISPDNGVYNTTVTIQGSNFSTTVTSNEVKFNGKPAVVTAAAAGQLTVTVPRGAGTGTVTVTVKGKTATGPVFNYTFTITVSTVAGSSRGHVDGTGTNAKFDSPRGICADSEGNLYVSDHYNHLIRKITPAGVVTTLAGSTRGYADGSGTAAQFWYPHGICTDAQNNIYVADMGNQRIRKITPAGQVSTFAGISPEGYVDGNAGSARFFGPEDVCSDAQGNIYVADANNYKVRKITQAGQVSTVAGSTYGYVDGTGMAAQFYTPRGLFCDASGNLFVADYFNTKIRKITPAGVVTTVAGSTQGHVDGTGISAKFDGPKGMWGDPQGNIYVSDDRNNTIRRITPAGVVSTFTGNHQVISGGDQDGAPGVALFRTPSDICGDAQGNLYIADFNNHRIRKISFE